MDYEQPTDPEAKARFCCSLGHANVFVVPLETKPVTREARLHYVRVVCERCGEREWMGLPEDEWKVLLDLFERGKVG